MTARILYDLPREQYDAITDRVNFSTLKLMGESPAHYKHAVDEKLTAEFDPRGDPDQSDALLQGEASHVAALEPEVYGGQDIETGLQHGPGELEKLLAQSIDPKSAPPISGRFAVYYGGKRDLRVHKYQGAVAKAQQAKAKLLTPAMHEFAQLVAKAVRTSPAAAPFIVGGRREVTLTWEHEDLGAPAFEIPGWSIPMKTRLDYLLPNAIVDLKTARTAKPDLFAKQAWNLGYFVQAALHIDAVKAATGKVLPYRWLVVETKAPHVVQVYEPSTKGLLRAREVYRDWLARLNVCRQTGEYPAYADGLMQLDPPAWATPEDVMEAA